LSGFVQRCPALQSVTIPGLVQPGVDISPLTALTALQELIIGGAAVDNDAAVEVLARLTGLDRLQIYHAPLLSDQGLLALTALRRLVLLIAWDCSFSEPVADGAENEEAADAGMTALQIIEGTTVSCWSSLAVFEHLSYDLLCSTPPGPGALRKCG
jgi:alkylhydroperoxidase family enzyme